MASKKQRIKNINAILANMSASDLPQLQRNVYKYTKCGAFVEFNTFANVVYTEDVDELKPEDIESVVVGSIVEGTDVQTESHVVDINVTSMKKVVKAFSDALESVEEEALQIWNDTHGCEGCQKHLELDEHDVVPVWSDCPECKGQGTII